MLQRRITKERYCRQQCQKTLSRFQASELRKVSLQITTNPLIVIGEAALCVASKW